MGDIMARVSLLLRPLCIYVFLLLSLVFTSDSVTIDSATTIRFYANLRPPNFHQRRFGKGPVAQGLFEYRLDRQPSSAYIFSLSLRLQKIKSGGKYPAVRLFKGSKSQSIHSSTPVIYALTSPFVNVTPADAHNRYSYNLQFPSQTETKADFDSSMKPVMQNAKGYFFIILGQKNETILRGQMKLKLQ
eukprot:TRINITY_DN5549_c0_g1_i4.p1 TRINITY_DN5549_c0_g1~~TRINITY_DN5549_c0_g1_i4.p1  ORF type:complete len:188 (-),score=5.06 TRINITY_DN5549_c0_g1_i4:186-749(-)